MKTLTNTGFTKCSIPSKKNISVKVKSDVVADRQKDIKRHTDRQMNQKLCCQIFNLRRPRHKTYMIHVLENSCT